MNKRRSRMNMPRTPEQPAAPAKPSEPMVTIDGVSVRVSSVLEAAAKIKPPVGSNGGKPVNACPICYGQYGGVGREKWRRQISGCLLKISYDCSACGHNWASEVRRVRIVESKEWKIVDAKTC